MAFTVLHSVQEYYNKKEDTDWVGGFLETQSASLDHGGTGSEKHIVWRVYTKY